MEKATRQEIVEEIMLRMKLLNVPEREVKMFQNGFIPVTLFSGKTQCELDPIHKKALACFNDHNHYGYVPYYITESWNFCDVVTILFVGPDKDDWYFEREDAMNGLHSVFSYIVGKDLYEFGSAYFSIEDNVLWRVN